MSPVNIGLILLSSLFHSLWNILTQTSKNSIYFSGLKGVWIILLALPAYFMFGGAVFHPEILFWAIISGSLHGAYMLCLSKAYSGQDISYVYPIARSAPVFVPVFAFFLLGETLEPVTIFAIIIIVTAIYILHFEGKVVEGLKNLFGAIQHRDLRWAFYTLGFVVAYSLVDKHGMDVFFRHFPEQAFANGIIFFFLEAVLCFSLYNAFIFFRHEPHEIIARWKQEWGKGLMSGLATVGSYGLICVVLQFEAVGPVVSLRQTSVLMVIYWGCWRLKEPFGRQRLIAGGLTVLGIALIGLN